MPIFHLATFFARREAKTRIRQHDWLKLAGEKIRREQVGSVPTFLSVRANKFVKWKIGLRKVSHSSRDLNNWVIQELLLADLAKTQYTRDDEGPYSRINLDQHR